LKRTGNKAADIHFHHIRIPLNLSKIMATPEKVMNEIKSFVKNVYQHSLMYCRDKQRGNMVDKY
jgi:hypothetical protein